jgi:hypothetical protein
MDPIILDDAFRLVKHRHVLPQITLPEGNPIQKTTYRQTVGYVEDLNKGQILILNSGQDAAGNVINSLLYA